MTENEFGVGDSIEYFEDGFENFTEYTYPILYILTFHRTHSQNDVRYVCEVDYEFLNKARLRDEPRAHVLHQEPSDLYGMRFFTDGDIWDCI